MRIENEVDSNMTNTIEYTFITPSAIEKGQGRGLKSLDEKRNLPSKSIFPQSSDLFKKHIKETERSKIFCILLFQTISKSFKCVKAKYFFHDSVLCVLSWRRRCGK